jgi:glycerophosphoryl diester phosphodiesterase
MYDENEKEPKLVPWTTWEDALDREMEWYLNAPVNEHGYPAFVHISFMDEKYQCYRDDFIPATQNGMGIISYIKYWKFKNRTDPRVLEFAGKMGDYLLKEANTPDKGAYPRFTRSTGYYNEFPLTRSSQNDAKYGKDVIEPDKGGIAGYALLEVYKVTEDQRYYDQALHNAEVLAGNMRKGNAKRSPWPFRVDAVTGEYWGEISSNMVYILRLFDGLIEMGENQYKQPREELWNWIITYQFNSSDSREESLWGQFFEDQVGENNRNAWAPLNMARYLVEKKDDLDPDWKIHAESCIQFSVKHFGMERPGGVICVGEQDADRRAWGGVNSTFGAVAAMFYAAGGGEEYREIAFRNLSWMTYFIREDGVVCDQTGEYHWLREGGWQEDCHTDVIHNFMDAINAVPEWATAKSPDGTVQAERKSYFPKPKNGHTYVIAHRGVHIGIPENTLAAYKEAIVLGCDFIEIDVRRTKDGRIVSVHNSTVDAYVEGVSGKVSDFTLAELKQMNIGRRVGPGWENERIPGIEEILQLCRGQIGIYLDLKEPLVPELIKLIKEYGMERDVVWCIPASKMDAIKEVQSNCYRCVPMPDPGPEENIDWIARQVKPRVIAPVMNDFSDEYVKIAHGYGIKVFVDEDKGNEAEWTKILDLGTDGIQTDNPKALIHFLEKRRKQNRSL